MTPINKTIPLSEVFYGHCEHRQCIHNDNGYCTYVEHIEEYLSYNEGNDYVTCRGFECKEGYCEECGNKLESVLEYHLIDSRYTPIRRLACIECESEGVK